MTIFTRDMPESFREKMDTDDGLSCEDIAEYLCQVMNGLGAIFYWEPIIEHGSGKGPEGRVKGKVFYNVECPWGSEAKDNPLLCNLCRGIFTRIYQNHREEAQIGLVKTLGKGDDRCIVKVKMGANGDAGSTNWEEMEVGA